jgi:hypothetical protein
MMIRSVFLKHSHAAADLNGAKVYLVYEDL